MRALKKLMGERDGFSPDVGLAGKNGTSPWYINTLDSIRIRILIP
jgi:hypothetical protein